MANVTLHNNPNEEYCPHFQASYLQKCMWASIGLGIEDALNQMAFYDHFFTIHFVSLISN
jgi:hypothetical protein